MNSFRSFDQQPCESRALSRRKRRVSVQASYVSAAAVLTTILVILITGDKHYNEQTTAIVPMQSFRGLETGAHLGPASSTRLIFDLALEPARSNYEIQIVNDVGKEILTKDAPPCRETQTRDILGKCCCTNSTSELRQNYVRITSELRQNYVRMRQRHQVDLF
jgi:hypothetical protein